MCRENGKQRSGFSFRREAAWPTEGLPQKPAGYRTDENKMPKGSTHCDHALSHQLGEIKQTSSQDVQCLRSRVSEEKPSLLKVSVLNLKGPDSQSL